MSNPRTDPSAPDHLADLIGRVALQDSAAMHELYDLTYTKLFRMAMRILGRREAAEDVLQEVFIAMWRFAPEYRRSIAAPMAWMTVILRSRVLDYLRRIRAFGADAEVSWGEELDDRLRVDEPEPPDRVLLAQEVHQLLSCMRRLEANQRRALKLAYFCEYSHSEVVREMNVPLGTVKAWIRRGVEKLRHDMYAMQAEQVVPKRYDISGSEACVPASHHQPTRSANL